MAMNVNGAGSIPAYPIDPNQLSQEQLLKLEEAQLAQLRRQDANFRESTWSGQRISSVPSGAMAPQGAQNTQNTAISADPEKREVHGLSAVGSSAVYGLTVPADGAMETSKMASLGQSLSTHSANLVFDMRDALILCAQASQEFGKTQQLDSANKTAMAVSLKFAAAKDAREGAQEKFAMSVAMGAMQIASGAFSLVQSARAGNDMKSAMGELKAPQVPQSLIAMVPGDEGMIEMSDIRATPQATPEAAAETQADAAKAPEAPQGSEMQAKLYSSRADLHLSVGAAVSGALNGAGGLMNASGEREAAAKNADAQEDQALAQQLESSADTNKSRKATAEQTTAKALDAVSQMITDMQHTNAQIMSGMA